MIENVLMKANQEISKKTITTTLIFLLIASLFIFLRLYKIETSLLFFNDMGRDFQVLLDWNKSGRPPLLGPQTSAFSFNQSAVYFYLLYPLFILSGQSAFSSIYTAVVIYIGLFGWGIWQLRHHPKLQMVLFASFWILTLHPEAIRQTRFIWNPSFIPPFFLAGLLAMLPPIKKSFKGAGWISALCFSLVLSLNYSSMIAVVSLLIVLFLQSRKKFITLVSKMLITGLIINLPTIAFEIRHQFVLTKLLITGQTLAQSGTGIFAKYQALLSYLLLPEQPIISSVLLLLMVVSMVVGYGVYRKRNQLKQAQTLGFFSLALLISFLLTLIAPFNVESHYIFGILTLAALTWSLLPKKIMLVGLLIISITWLDPQVILARFSPARRTVVEIEQCYQQYCQQWPTAIYVSMQSGILPYHNAPEHRYFMRQAGCNVKNIEQSNTESEYMAVVLDDSTYEHGKTAFNELTLFGKSEVVDRLQCQENLEVITLKRIMTQ